MAAFEKDTLRQFLCALKASGTQPSPNLASAIIKLSGMEEPEAFAMINEVIGTSKETENIGWLLHLAKE